jgi:tripartite-type tricarboxylate transporter receptor subunit TctC
LLARRSFLAAGFAPAILPAIAKAETTLPEKGLRVIVGFPAGGGAALMAQIIAPELERRLGRRVVVEHKPGETGVFAGTFLKSAPTDGSVIAFMPSTTLALKAVVDPFPFDPEKDFAALSLAGTFQTAIATARAIDVRNLAEYVAWVKAGDAERGRFGITLADPLLRIYSSAIGRDLGIVFKGVGYRGAAPLVKDLESGAISAGAGGLTSFLESHRGRKITMLAISGSRRSPVARDVPTATELGYPALLMEEWYGFFSPSGVSPAIQAEWNRQLQPALAAEEVRTKLGQLGLEVGGSTQEEAETRLAAHLDTWKVRVTGSDRRPAN